MEGEESKGGKSKGERGKEGGGEAPPRREGEGDERESLPLQAPGGKDRVRAPGGKECTYEGSFRLLAACRTFKIHV